MDGLHDLDRGEAQVGDLHLRDAPDRGDLLAVLGVLDVTASRQLVAALPVLAPALTIALAGDGAIAAAGPTDASGGQNQVDA